MVLLWFPPCSHLPKLQACLQSSDVNYRIAVGETIALMVELGRDIDEVNAHRQQRKYIMFSSHIYKYVIFNIIDVQLQLCVCTCVGV